MEPVTVGKYTLVKKIASGGMAEIFVAREHGAPGLEKHVVVKRILPQLALNDEFLKMFLDEARVAATLQHPNIVQMYDIGSADGDYWITMEYLQGEDVRHILKALAKARKPLPLEHALNILIGACAGLHYAHEKVGFDGSPLQIVHRDVNPQNIFVTWDGIVKVVDFGIAKAANRYNETYGGQLKGKIQYMSPEQCRSEKLDKRSDVYSLGILLYELTTGLRLYKGESEFQVMKKIITEPPPMPSMVLKSYPKALERVVLKALKKKPDERHQSAQELQAELEQFARDHKLPISSIALSQFMKDVFGVRVEVHEVNDSQIVTGMVVTPPPETTVPRHTAPMPFMAQATSTPTAVPPLPPLAPMVTPAAGMGEDAPTVRVEPGRKHDMNDAANDSRQTQPGPFFPKTRAPLRRSPTARDDESNTDRDLLRSLEDNTEPSIVVTPSMMVPMPTEEAPMARLAALASTLPMPAPVAQAMPRPSPTPPVVAPVASPRTSRWPERRPETEIVDPLPAPAARPATRTSGPMAAQLAERLEPEYQDKPRFQLTRNRVFIVLGAVGVLAMGLVIWAASSGEEETATASSSPSESAKTPDTQPGGPAPPAAMAPAVAAPNPAPPPPLADAPGFAKIASKPFGATVLVDGARQVETTPTVVVGLRPGPHDVKLVLEGHEDQTGSVEVKPNEMVTFDAVLVEKPGKKKPEKTEPPPVVAAAAEAPARAGEPPELKPDPTRSEPKARPAPRKPKNDDDPGAGGAGGGGEGELRVASTPSCEVLVDGESKGFTPVSVKGLSPGKHTLKLVSDKFAIDKTVTVSVAGGSVTKKKFTFPVE